MFSMLLAKKNDSLVYIWRFIAVVQNDKKELEIHISYLQLMEK
jgi:hypothetical protein